MLVFYVFGKLALIFLEKLGFFSIESVPLKAYFLSKTKQAFGSHEWLK